MIADLSDCRWHFMVLTCTIRLAVEKCELNRFIQRGVAAGADDTALYDCITFKWLDEYRAFWKTFLAVYVTKPLA